MYNMYETSHLIAVIVIQYVCNAGNAYSIVWICEYLKYWLRACVICYSLFWEVYHNT